jgi:hypothetical protein
MTRRWLFAVALASVTASTASFAQQPAIETPSLMTTPVWLLNGNHAVSQGTGFFYATLKPDGTPRTVFLVTNYHVVTGHEPGTPGRDGDKLFVLLHSSHEDPSLVAQVQVPLYSQANEPLWASSMDTPDADVVLLPVSPKLYAGSSLIVFSESHTLADIKIRPTSEVALVGYPYGFYDVKNSLPIWKTGHIASEPDVDFEGKPVFLADISAFPGMSGSPLLAVVNGISSIQSGQMPVKLLGIFSAMRVFKEKKTDLSGYTPDLPDTSLQLGYVWKARVIVEIAKLYDLRQGEATNGGMGKRGNALRSYK